MIGPFSLAARLLDVSEIMMDFHDLRHTFARILLSNRTELIEVSKFLGHSTIATTANIYAHLDMSNKEHTASVMSDILAGMNTTKAPK